MHPVRSLPVLGQLADRRLDLLNGLIAKLPNAKPSADDDRIVAFATVETINAWATFARAFYVSSAFGARTGGGIRACPAGGPLTAGQAIDHSVKTLRSKIWKPGIAIWTHREEPTWHEPLTLDRLSTSLALSNHGSLQAAFGVQTKALKQLPTFRNFYAHRNQDTAQKVRKLIAEYKNPAFTNRTTATQFLCSFLPGRPQSALADWIADLRIMVALMVQ